MTLEAPDLQKDSSLVSEPVCLNGHVCVPVYLSMYTHVQGERENTLILGRPALKDKDSFIH